MWQCQQTSRELCRESDSEVIECMVKAGVGLMVSLRERSVIQLYHLETLEYLQDINVASAITLTLNGVLHLFDWSGLVATLFSGGVGGGLDHFTFSLCLFLVYEVPSISPAMGSGEHSKIPQGVRAKVTTGNSCIFVNFELANCIWCYCFS